MLYWSAMVSVMMRPTMQTATMMVGTVADLMFLVRNLAFFIENIEIINVIAPFCRRKSMLKYGFCKKSLRKNEKLTS